MKDKRKMDGTKMLWHMDRIKEWEQGYRIPPIMIDIGLTKNCNARCIYCYGVYQGFGKGKINREPLIDLVSTAKFEGIKAIAFIGDGEPTLNKHLYEALEKATCDISMSTNGILLDNDYKRKTVLENSKWMRFNLSAGNRERYKFIHGVDKFDVVKKNIEAMVKLKKENKYSCDIGLQAVYVPRLMDQDMIDLSKFAVESGVDYLLIKQCSLPDENKRVNKIEFDVNEYDNELTKKVLTKCENMSTKNTQIVPKWNLISQKGQRPYNGCLSIPFLPQISGNGDVYPCGQMFQKEKYKDFFMGNINETPFKEIIKSDRYWEVIEKMKNFDVHKGCSGACRQDKINEFLFEYVNKPKGVNFI